MNVIWANRLVAGDKFTWDDVPESRKPGVKAELYSRVNSGAYNQITPEQYEEIVGEPYGA